MRPFDIFTNDDGVVLTLNPSLNGQTRWICIEDANRILNERASGKGYTKMCELFPNTKVCTDIFKPTIHDSTHEALVFLRPIEEEVEECKCVKFKNFFDSLDLVESGWRNQLVSFCPDCGKDLR